MEMHNQDIIEFDDNGPMIAYRAITVQNIQNEDGHLTGEYHKRMPSGRVRILYVGRTDDNEWMEI